MSSNITQRGATGPLSLTAQYGQFQQTPQTETLYGATVTDTELNTLLGSRWDLQDGREVKLVLAGAANLAQGKLMAAPANIANHQNLVVTAYTTSAPVPSVSAPFNTPSQTTNPTTVTVTLGGTAATANQYQNGYAVVTSGTGLGQTLQIASNPAQATTTGALVVQLADTPNVALDTTSRVSLIPNPGNGVIVNLHTALQQPVGVTLYPITAANYGYIVSHGVTACLNAGGTTTGSELSASASVDGAVTNGVIAQGFVGFAIIAGTDTQYQPIFVNL